MGIHYDLGFLPTKPIIRDGRVFWGNAFPEIVLRNGDSFEFATTVVVDETGAMSRSAPAPSED